MLTLLFIHGAPAGVRQVLTGVIDAKLIDEDPPRLQVLRQGKSASPLVYPIPGVVHVLHGADIIAILPPPPELRIPEEIGAAELHPSGQVDFTTPTFKAAASKAAEGRLKRAYERGEVSADQLCRVGHAVALQRWRDSDPNWATATHTGLQNALVALGYRFHFERGEELRFHWERTGGGGAHVVSNRWITARDALFDAEADLRRRLEGEPPSDLSSAAFSLIAKGREGDGLAPPAPFGHRTNPAGATEGRRVRGWDMGGDEPASMTVAEAPERKPMRLFPDIADRDWLPVRLYPENWASPVVIVQDDEGSYARAARTKGTWWLDGPGVKTQVDFEPTRFAYVTPPHRFACSCCREWLGTPHAEGCPNVSEFGDPTVLFGDTPPAEPAAPDRKVMNSRVLVIAGEDEGLPEFGEQTGVQVARMGGVLAGARFDHVMFTIGAALRLTDPDRGADMCRRWVREVVATKGKTQAPPRVVFHDPLVEPDDVRDVMSEAISDSMDQDWTSTDGAKAILRRFESEGYVVVHRFAPGTFIPRGKAKEAYTEKEAEEAAAIIADAIAAKSAPKGADAEFVTVTLDGVEKSLTPTEWRGADLYTTFRIKPGVGLMLPGQLILGVSLVQVTEGMAFTTEAVADPALKT